MTFQPHLPISNRLSGDLGTRARGRLLDACHCGLFRPGAPGHLGNPDQRPSPGALAWRLGRVRNATDRSVTERDGPIPRNGVAIDNRRNTSPHATSFLQFLLVIRPKRQRSWRGWWTKNNALHLALGVTRIRMISEHPHSSVTARGDLHNRFERGCCGNSVCPPLAAAIVGANCLHIAAGAERRTA